ncbi:MAPEG family protein [Sphingomicrobium clamense]|uniref:MAPEG family protein n=1 Tax=Sphingomicrobium clamense TaxID=2851013 RepID=A0ABS6V6G4_9SPHN|nr:MAPEG family protein [Sphingomicrobium sp. B8]MBW0145152.1 MAPEG family protein [Sphingomicrobium sp. B8]
MNDYPLLGPVIILVGWTLVMLIWASISIQRGLKTADTKGLTKGARARDLEGRMDDRFSFPRRNYEHLVEQPTLFYAIALALALMGERGIIALSLAWAYVAARILHSIAQGTGGSRTIGFAVSSLALLGLFIIALIAFLN